MFDVDVQSFGGQKLIRRGDISIGSPVRKMLRLPRFSPDGHAEQQLCICGKFYRYQAAWMGLM
jgi:cleavage and polyadenylation specificity factor subunit 1